MGESPPAGPVRFRLACEFTTPVAVDGNGPASVAGDGRAELAGVLRATAVQVLDGHQSGTVLDGDGRTVGEWAVEG